MKPATIEFHIENLVLDGIATDGPTVASATQRELVRMLAAQGLPVGMREAGRVSALQAGAIELGAQPKAETLGQAIASSVFGAK